MHTEPALVQFLKWTKSKRPKMQNNRIQLIQKAGASLYQLEMPRLAFCSADSGRSAAKNITIPKILFDDAQDIRLGLLKNESFEMAAINRLGT